MTSGEGTGIQIEDQKITKFRQLVKDNMLGLASGVNADNITTLINYVFIVGTYLENSEGNINQEKLAKIMNIFDLHNQTSE